MINFRLGVSQRMLGDGFPDQSQSRVTLSPANTLFLAEVLLRMTASQSRMSRESNNGILALAPSSLQDDGAS